MDRWQEGRRHGGHLLGRRRLLELNAPHLPKPDSISAPHSAQHTQGRQRAYVREEAQDGDVSGSPTRCVSPGHRVARP
eukprot:1421639-Rhodomonas_salina.1